jgi:hypothetical protein
VDALVITGDIAQDEQLETYTVLRRAANSRGPVGRGSHRIPSHPIEDPLDPLRIGKVPENAPALVPGPMARL